MLSTNIKKGVAILFGMALLSFSITGCGGGSSDTIATVPVDTGAIAETEKVVITEDNIGNVLNSTFSAYNEDGIEIPLVKSSTTNALKSVSKHSELSGLQKAISVAQSFKTIAESGTETCTDGGSLTYNGDDVTGGTITFDNCTEGTLVMDGSASISIDTGLFI